MGGGAQVEDRPAAVDSSGGFREGPGVGPQLRDEFRRRARGAFNRTAAGRGRPLLDGRGSAGEMQLMNETQALHDDWDQHWTEFSAASDMGPATRYRQRVCLRLLGIKAGDEGV